jgi:outer membrane protein assembly factor BamB
MSRSVPLAAIAAAALLSACSTVSKVGDAVWPFNGHHKADANAEPQDGRVSILTFEQQLAPDPDLSGHAIVVPAPAPIADWPQPGGNADNAPINVMGSTDLNVDWRTDLGAGSNRRVQIAAPPVIADGKLYFLDADHRVHAVDANNGHRLWTHELRPKDSKDHSARGGGVAVADGRVFVTTGFGFAVALDAASGDEIWRAQAGAPFHAAPTAAGGRVLAVTNDSELVSFDAETGAVQWNYQAIAEPARILAASSPAVEGDTVVAPFASGEIIALLAANGRRLWTDSLSRSGRMTSLSAINDIAGRPAIDGNAVFAASHSGVLAAIDYRTGTRIWSRAFASTQTPWIAGDVLYAVSVDAELAAFSRTTGGVYWVRQLRRYKDEKKNSGRIAWTGPIMVGGKLILANSLGEVVAVAPETGEVGATRELHAPIFIPPIAANGMIYFVTDEARLIVLK